MTGESTKTVSAGSPIDLVSINQQNAFVFSSTFRCNAPMFSGLPEERIDRSVRLSELEELIDENGVDYLCNGN